MSAVSADAETALVEALAVTPGNVHDGQAGGTALQAKGGSPRIVATGMWGRPGDDTPRKLRRWNYAIQRVRCRIERIIGTWKRSYGLRRMRWRGLPKACLHVRLTAIADNPKQVASILGRAAA